jgi:hypothetical protein
VQGAKNARKQKKEDQNVMRLFFFGIVAQKDEAGIATGV